MRIRSLSFEVRKKLTAKENSTPVQSSLIGDADRISFFENTEKGLIWLQDRTNADQGTAAGTSIELRIINPELFDCHFFTFTPHGTMIDCQ